MYHADLILNLRGPIPIPRVSAKRGIRYSYSRAKHPKFSIFAPRGQSKWEKIMTRGLIGREKGDLSLLKVNAAERQREYVLTCTSTSFVIRYEWTR